MRQIEGAPGLVTLGLAWTLAGLVLLAGSSGRARADEPLQVTMFAVAATPHGSKLDPKLAQIEPQLRKVLPNHAFKLLDRQSKTRQVGESVVCDLGDDQTAKVTWIGPADADGKVKLRCELVRGRKRQLDTVVTTPTNQLFFYDQKLADGSRLLIGVGAR